MRKKEAFNSFFRKGYRKSNESVQEYIARREAEYERLTSLSTSTSLSEDLRTYFLLELAGIDDETHKRILAMNGNDYAWTGITNTMLIQLDKDETQRHA